MEGAAPVVAEPTEAPVEGTAPKEAAPKPRTPDDDFEDVLKKSGGLKYKAGGKEKAITSTADLRRMLSRIDGTDQAASEAAKKSQKAEARERQIASLAKLKPAERLKALGDLGIDPKLVQEAIEESILEADSKAKASANLSPRERELQAALEARDAELAEHRTAKERWEAEQTENQHVAQVNETYGRLEKVAVGALTKAKISGEHAAKFLPAIADHLDRNERLQLGHDEDELAEVVLREHESLADQYYGGMEVPALADKLEGMTVPDPSDPSGKKTTTRLKLLMLECATRLRAKINGAPAPVRTTSQARDDSSDSVAAKMARARTFGSGNR